MFYSHFLLFFFIIFNLSCTRDSSTEPPVLQAPATDQASPSLNRESESESESEFDLREVDLILKSFSSRNEENMRDSVRQYLIGQDVGRRSQILRGIVSNSEIKLQLVTDVFQKILEVDPSIDFHTFIDVDETFTSHLIDGIYKIYENFVFAERVKSLISYIGQHIGQQVDRQRALQVLMLFTHNGDSNIRLRLAEVARGLNRGGFKILTELVLYEESRSGVQDSNIKNAIANGFVKIAFNLGITHPSNLNETQVSDKLREVLFTLTRAHSTDVNDVIFIAQFAGEVGGKIGIRLLKDTVATELEFFNSQPSNKSNRRKIIRSAIESVKAAFSNRRIGREETVRLVFDFIPHSFSDLSSKTQILVVELAGTVGGQEGVDLFKELVADALTSSESAMKGAIIREIRAALASGEIDTEQSTEVLPTPEEVSIGDLDDYGRIFLAELAGTVGGQKGVDFFKELIVDALGRAYVSLPVKEAIKKNIHVALESGVINTGQSIGILPTPEEASIGDLDDYGRIFLAELAGAVGGQEGVNLFIGLIHDTFTRNHGWWLLSESGVREAIVEGMRTALCTHKRFNIENVNEILNYYHNHHIYQLYSRQKFYVHHVIEGINDQRCEV